jgi:hypothetical protein
MECEVFLGERGAEREEFVATGIAPEGREAEEASDEGEGAGNVFGGDAAEVGVAAVAAVGVEGEAEGNGAGVEALFTGFATPGKNVQSAEKIVG